MAKPIRTGRDPFEMLELLLGQDQFELVLPQTGKDLRLVYMMNDAAESFLVFRGASVTGEYRPDYEGGLEVLLGREAERYALVVYQGEHAVTVFFEELVEESFLYNYGRLGHFWVKENEHLRLLEYRIAILADKCRYLGPDAANPKERRLAELVQFPPLNACCYPAVSREYFTPDEEMWIPSKEAFQVMEEISREAGDLRFLSLLQIYRTFPNKFTAKRIAAALRNSRHAGIADLISEKLKKASAEYPDRSFGSEMDSVCTELLKVVEKRQTQLETCGYHSEIVREEPFETVKDSVGFCIYLMIWKEKKGKRRVAIETFIPDETGMHRSKEETISPEHRVDRNEEDDES